MKADAQAWTTSFVINAEAAAELNHRNPIEKLCLWELRGKKRRDGVTQGFQRVKLRWSLRAKTHPSRGIMREPEPIGMHSS